MPNETRPPGRPDPADDNAQGRNQGRGGRPRRPRSGDADDDRGFAPAEDLVVVRFKGHRKGYYHNRAGIALLPGQYCLVEADRGRDLGRVTYVGPGPASWWSQARRQGVLGQAEPAELARLHQNRGDEWQFWDIAREKIAARRLKMDLVSVERQFDNKKITFYFTAEKRVDFRELVRDLAAIFRTRIELRQIGVRDEARLKGGLGICGREFCCSSFLHEFVPVTLKMAKVQQLPLNPGKLSGPCGRLRCCVTYEHQVYQDLRRALPRVGATVGTPQGGGRVRKLDLLREQVTVEIPGAEAPLTFAASELHWERSDNLPAPRPPERGGCRGGGCGGRNARTDRDGEGGGGGH